jgi:hypothetical protein
LAAVQNWPVGIGLGTPGMLIGPEKTQVYAPALAGEAPNVAEVAKQSAVAARTTERCY